MVDVNIRVDLYCTCTHTHMHMHTHAHAYTHTHTKVAINISTKLRRIWIHVPDNQIRAFSTTRSQWHGRDDTCRGRPDTYQLESL